MLSFLWQSEYLKNTNTKLIHYHKSPKETKLSSQLKAPPHLSANV